MIYEGGADGNRFKESRFRSSSPVGNTGGKHTPPENEADDSEVLIRVVQDLYGFNLIHAAVQYSTGLSLIFRDALCAPLLLDKKCHGNWSGKIGQHFVQSSSVSSNHQTRSAPDRLWCHGEELVAGRGRGRGRGGVVSSKAARSCCACG